MVTVATALLGLDRDAVVGAALPGPGGPWLQDDTQSIGQDSHCCARAGKIQSVGQWEGCENRTQ